MDSYKLDKRKTYIYQDGKTKASVVRYLSQWHEEEKWELWSDGEREFLQNEDSKGNYIGYPYSEYETKIEYPLALEHSWEPGYEGQGTNIIIGIGQVVKTKAGTFKDVVVVQDNDGHKSYYAKDIGLIKAEQNGKVERELVSAE